jgi:hypothetical protein
MAGRLDEGLRSEIKGGIKAWNEDLAWHLEVGGRVAWGDQRRREEVVTVGRCGRKTNLTARADLTERREGGGQLESVNQKGKRTSANTPSTRGLARPARLNFARERREASGAGWANDRVGRKVGLAESKEKEFLKNWISEFTKAMEICTRRFRRNFDMRILPKFF